VESGWKAPRGGALAPTHHDVHAWTSPLAPTLYRLRMTYLQACSTAAAWFLNPGAENTAVSQPPGVGGGFSGPPAPWGWALLLGS
jgi:hypothetical protein